MEAGSLSFMVPSCWKCHEENASFAHFSEWRGVLCTRCENDASRLVYEAADRPGEKLAVAVAARDAWVKAGGSGQAEIAARKAYQAGRDIFRLLDEWCPRPESGK